MTLLESLRLGLESLWRHKLRSLLTMLGVISGVAAVMAMLAIGTGAEREALQAIEVLGVHNILVKARSFAEEELMEFRQKSRGLSRRDVEVLRAVLPHLRHLSPGKRVTVRLFNVEGAGPLSPPRVLGASASYQAVANLSVRQGRFFTEREDVQAAPVCILGAMAKRRFFGAGEAVGQWLRINEVWLKVIGVLEPKTLKLREFQGVPLETVNEDILLPLGTALKRFTFAPLESELDALFLMTDGKISSAEMARIVDRVLRREHHGVEDYTLIVPETLLEQHRRTQRLFTIVLGSIAGISLLVGGIGIMNIMLATVWERTPEIGLRRAVGARRRDILWQFLLEAMMIGVIGGVIGVVLGFGLAESVVRVTHLRVVVTYESMLFALGVALFTALLFGLYPAQRAARLDPVVALQYE